MSLDAIAPEALDNLTLELAVAGLNIVQPLSTLWYNEHVTRNNLPLQPIPSFGRAGGALCLLIGNSRDLWDAFLRWLRAQPDPSSIAEPLDYYTTSTIMRVIVKAAGTVAHDIFWSSESGDRLVSMQRVALTSGLCCHDPETQLSIHPAYGAWCAFRACVVFDADGPMGGAPPPCPDLLSHSERAAAREAMADALKASDEARLCAQLHGGEAMTTEVRLAWAKLRDCVLIGKEQYRYSELQLAYHYTKDKALLLQALNDLWEESAHSYDSAQDDRPWH
mmetsp:Transcript_39837/g.66077  ORF Transcript_39837/g.66077 Transcript_39837/m.66077 type:complete len:278 (+) Transcript_39837:46-879(+)|eukprot:CAMPEP_0119328990 /NCGR_PEP_ID=MMETSP1333-20130426/74741_1 /TAXON_ID=418940 /ORGANISM="Scyphosphaera apsteinii, Strain RCC1455" /LENGTH=277 /DNA_ID=CAMNT_0007337997 /DNA_START=41 /DNA_END=874 /DNA_ORIENTATION=-